MKRFWTLAVLLAVFVLAINVAVRYGDEDESSVDMASVETGRITTGFYTWGTLTIKHDTPPNDNWETQSTPIDWTPRIQPGEQAVMLTTEETVSLSGRGYQPGELCWLAIYDYGTSAPYVINGDNKDTEIDSSVFPKPSPHRENFKLIVYRLTEEEFQNQSNSQGDKS